MSEFLNVLIVEDQAADRDRLVDYCERHPLLKIGGIVPTAEQFQEQLCLNHFDLAIVDIELPDSLGTLAVKEAAAVPPVIFSTAHPHFAVEAFELGVVDFLLKPFPYERFLRSVDRVLEAARSLRNESLRTLGVSVKVEENFFFIPFHEIVYVEAQGKGSVIHTTRSDLYTPRLLIAIAAKLPEANFMRVHRQFVINMSFISRLQRMTKGDFLAVLSDEENSQIPVSRSHSIELRRWLGLE